MTREDCLHIIEKNSHRNLTYETVFKKEFKDLYDELCEISFNENLTFRQKLYHFLHNDIDTQLGRCAICGNRTYFISLISGYNQYCSANCSNIGKGEKISRTKKSQTKEQKQQIEDKRITTLKEKYGDNYAEEFGKQASETRKNFSTDDNIRIQEKHKTTCLHKYGTESYSQTQEFKENLITKHDDILEKSKQTRLLKYNDEWYNNTEKARCTCMEKYGVEHILQVPQISKKQTENYEKTCMEKYGVSNTSKLNTVKNKISETHKNKMLDTHSDLIIGYSGDDYICRCQDPDCHDCQDRQFVINRTLLHNRVVCGKNICTKKFPKLSQYSQLEKNILDFVKTIYNGNIVENDRKILSGKELDIYIPEMCLAIEINGCFWHSDWNMPNKNSHQEKYIQCRDKGIQLLHIWEDDWNYKQGIVKDLLRSKFGVNLRIYARKCQIQEIDSAQCKEFLNKYHLQGSVNSKIRIGLFYNNELVEVCTFGKLRNFMKSKSDTDEYELYRLCTKSGVSVVGGFSKLLKYFITKYNPKLITTYASCDISNGNCYLQTGFTFDKITTPGYSWLIHNTRMNRFLFRKDVLIADGYDKNKTENEIMKERGAYKCYDSGNLKFVLKFTT